MNGLRNDHPSEFEVNDRDEFSNYKFEDEFSRDNENERRDSLLKEKQNELSYRPSSSKDHEDLSTSDTIAKGSNREHEFLMTIEEPNYDSKGEHRDTRLSFIAASDSLETETNLYTEKNVVECEFLELQGSYKGINHHTVKDISIDKEMPPPLGFLNESIKDAQSGHPFQQPLKCDDNYETTKGDFNSTERIRANEHEVDEESNCKLLNQEKQMLSSSGVGGETSTEAWEDDTFVDGKLSIQEDVEESNLLYKIKVESGSITLKFNSSTAVGATMTNGRTEHIVDQSVELVDAIGHKDTDGNQVQCNKNEVSSAAKVNEAFLNVKDWFSNGFSATGNAQSVTCKDMPDKNVHNQSHDDKNENSGLFSSHDLLQVGSSRSINSINSDGQASDLHLSKNEHTDSANHSGVSDVGNPSSSSASLVAYSGPIAYSGSLSHRSDSSAATSGRSFAFPILQPEWNSSPVKLTKGEDRHFQKHKGWRSSLLCCRF